MANSPFVQRPSRTLFTPQKLPNHCRRFLCVGGGGGGGGGGAYSIYRKAVLLTKNENQTGLMAL